MRIQTYIPEPVSASIRRHLRAAVRRAVEAHESGQEDEDTLTGQFGFAIRTPKPRRVSIDGQTWTWQIHYHKLRGRGPNAAERTIGADGLIEFSLDTIEQHVSKTSLFQAKTNRGNLQGLLAQCIALTTWKEAAFVVKYAPNEYTAMDLEAGLKQALGLPFPDEIPVDRFIMDYFIACLNGDPELHYEPSDRTLRWRDRDGQVVHASFDVRHGLEIRVNGPKLQSLYRGERIESETIHEHRMDTTDEEMLGVGPDATSAAVKRARKNTAKLYHVDKHQRLEQRIRDILDLRMKESNAAADRVLVRLKENPRT